MADTLFFTRALLPDGWADNVLLTCDQGVIRTVRRDAPPPPGGISGAIALPGLASLHSHTFQRAMAGLAETRGPSSDSFWSWRQVMYRFLGLLDPEEVEAIAAFAFMEMLEAGFTSVGEFHYLHHDRTGQPYADRAELAGRIVAAAGASGIGLTLLPVFYAHGGFGAVPAHEGQRRFLNDLDGFHRLVEGARAALAALPGARLGIAPHSLRAVAPEELQALLEAWPEGPMHIHIAEQMKEVEDCIAWSGRRPVEWLFDHVAVDSRWCLVHATHLNEAETRHLAESGAVAGLCPITEANLGDGTFGLAEFMAQGGRLGVGTDSNVEISAPGELRQLEYSQRLAHRARNVSAQAEGESTGGALYRAALAGGAQALGQPVAGLEPGERADIVCLSADHPDLAAASGDRLIDGYVFCAGRAAIDHVYVGGQCLVEGGRHRDHAKLASRYKQVIRKLATR
ncbi:formimidoylglutamate deiminase [Rhabdaerophilum sp. SD176]|uniref:formimidoylglutamate deiminase n=1 Tax=Rhabdaerophilum sp. SD176 TaxID=2983548 RepID=UPI0024DFD2A1|nr:formimidoylglutamate deiminase [Rhabdaerophilum sp. SD176]